ncbi:hypothetical protein Tco_0613742 [Tanacetum coccineum]
MASESSSQSQQQQITHASNVYFEYDDGIIAYNNAIALLEYQPMLQFLSKSCVSNALTKQPSAYYSKYLREFWYSVEVDTVTNSITFSLSNFEKPLSFIRDKFTSVIGLSYSENYVSLSNKGDYEAWFGNSGIS